MTYYGEGRDFHGRDRWWYIGRYFVPAADAKPIKDFPLTGLPRGRIVDADLGTGDVMGLAIEQDGEIYDLIPETRGTIYATEFEAAMTEFRAAVIDQLFRPLIRNILGPKSR